MTVQPVDQAAVDAVAASFYEETIKAPSTIRGQAQAGSGIATAAAAALVATSAFANVGKEHLWVQVIGFIALVAWAFTALLYVYAVTGKVEVNAGGSADGATEFVDVVVARASTERKALEKRAKRALMAASLAVAATLVTIASAATTSSDPDTEAGYVILTDDAVKHFSGACLVGSELHGEIETDSVDTGSLVIHVKACPTGVGEVRIDRRAVIGSIER